MEGEMIKANANINLYKDNKNWNNYKQKINWYVRLIALSLIKSRSVSKERLRD